MIVFMYIQDIFVNILNITEFKFRAHAHTDLNQN
jgi:hypothetical protein